MTADELGPAAWQFLRLRFKNFRLGGAEVTRHKTPPLLRSVLQSKEATHLRKRQPQDDCGEQQRKYHNKQLHSDKWLNTTIDVP